MRNGQTAELLDGLVVQILLEQKAFRLGGDRLCGFLFTLLNPDRKHVREKTLNLAQYV